MGLFSKKSKEAVADYRPAPPPMVSEEQQRMNRTLMEEQLAADRARREGRTE